MGLELGLGHEAGVGFLSIVHFQCGIKRCSLQSGRNGYIDPPTIPHSRNGIQGKVKREAKQVVCKD